jgi:hypothetical protein
MAARLVGSSDTAAAAAAWFGTPLFFYMYLAPVFAHACSAFAVALFLFVWLRVRGRWTPWGCMALGAAAALMVMVREQDLFFIAGPAFDFLLDLFGRPRRSMTGGALAGVAAAAVVYLPQAAVYLVLNGRIGPSRLVTRKMLWTSPHAFSVLFSPEHGLFVWTPLAFIGMCGLALFLLANESSSVLSTFERRRLAVCLAIMTALQVYVAGSVDSWTVAGAFGQRRFVSLTAILTVGMAALLQVLGTRRALRAVTAVVVVLCVWWNLGLMAQFGLHTMDRQKLDLRDNFRQTFVTLPLAAPSLMWRYLTDRASFYNQPRR